MPGVKLLVYVEITNEDIRRLHLTLCSFSLSNYWFLILALNIEVEVFNLNNLWTLIPPKKSWTYTPKWDIQNKK